MDKRNTVSVETQKKQAVKKESVKKRTTTVVSKKATVENSKKETTAESITDKLHAIVEADSKKNTAEEKRLYNLYKKQIDKAYKKMEGCYLETAFALHSIYRNKLYKLEDYKNIYDFAKENYSIARGTCNNFINICEKFGLPNENGNITKIAPEYEGYSTSQLAVMLTFPVELLKQCDPAKSVRELKRMRLVHDAEQAIEQSKLEDNAVPEKDVVADAERLNESDTEVIEPEHFSSINKPEESFSNSDSVGKRKYVCSVKDVRELQKKIAFILSALDEVKKDASGKDASIEINIVY